MKDEKFGELVKNFYTYLIESKQEYLSLFSKLQIQIEGWFKGELMNYLDHHNIVMSTENREVRINDNSRRKVDLKIEIDNEFYWIELKHILVGYQKEQPLPLGFYFNKGTYISGDIEKLGLIEQSDKRQHGYSLVFISTNYTKEGLKNSTQVEIITRDNLNKKVNESLEKRKDHEVKVCIKTSNYNEQLHFGYTLLGIMNNNK